MSQVSPTHQHRLSIAPVLPPLRSHLPFGEPAGTPDRIEVTSKWLERDSKPWLPVTGEIHYSRIPRDRWEEVVAKAVAGGLTSIASYVFWQAHEPIQGEFRWDGNRDLRAFIEICAAHGVDVIVRMGPWAHGEARYGGFPDWLMALDIPLRTNDLRYLELARTLYGQTIAQLRGLMRADGGPIVGIQIENELYDNPEHLNELRTIAQELGLTSPLWTATGWGGAKVPESLFPLYSGYADGFWDENTVDWPQFSRFHFQYSEQRDDLSVGQDLREALDGITLDPNEVPLKQDHLLPFATCELGGGMHVAYHRRPLVTSQDVANLALAKVGSGSIWQGYYMYSGGTLRQGPNGTEHESQATGYPNDVPTKSYDFYAPLGEHAQVRPHYHLLRRQHMWFDLEKDALAAMGTTIGGGSDEPGELRWSVRSDGERGYVFFTTYQPKRQPLDAQPGVQVELELTNQTLRFPATPVDLPQGISVAWPFMFPLGSGLTLRSATALILTKVTDHQGEICVLVATAGVPVELVIAGVHAVSGSGVGQVVEGNTVVELTEAPGAQTLVELSGYRLLILDEETANKTYRFDLAGQHRLVVSSEPLYLNGTELQDLIIHPHSNNVEISVLPPVSSLGTDQGQMSERSTHLWGTWQLQVPGAGVVPLRTGPQPVSAHRPIPVLGGPMNRLSAPTDFSQAARVPVELPDGLDTEVDRILLRVHWTGDVGRAVVDGQVISDHFWHGREWDIDLTPHLEAVQSRGITLELLPWAHKVGVWVDPSVRDIPDGITISKLELIMIPRVRVSVA